MTFVAGFDPDLFKSLLKAICSRRFIGVDIGAPVYAPNAQLSNVAIYSGFRPDFPGGFHPFERQDVFLDNWLLRSIVVPMALGTKNRQQQAAEVCKQYLREKHPENLGLVEEYIAEIEGTGKNHDVAKWGQFSDASWKNDEMLKRLGQAFETWLNP